MGKSFALVGMMVAVAVSACGPNQRIMNSAQERRDSPGAEPVGNVAPAASSFEHDLNAMRNADFNFIYVFRRRDGAVMDAEDKSFIGRLTPAEMNRRTLSDEGKAVIIGSNFRLPAENLNAFKTRFAFEDHSKPESEIMNANSNR
jgi:hypothetical protein